MTTANNKRKTQILVAVSVGALLIILIVTLAALGYDDTNNEYRVHHTSLNDNWTVISSEGEFQLNLPNKVTTYPDETTVLRNRLPNGIEEYMVFALRNYHQKMEVLIDGQTVYAFPNPGWNGFGNLISDEWCFVDLHPEYSGKEIEIRLTNTYMSRFSGDVGDFYYGRDNSVLQHIKNTNRGNFAMGIVVMVLGLILIIISIIYRKHTVQTPNAAMGMALLCIGAWLTNRAKMPIYPAHSESFYALSLLALFLVAPSIFLYSYFRSSERKKVSIWGFYICIGTDIFLILSCFFIKYNVETLAMLAYFMCSVALLHNGYLLYTGAFGKFSPFRSKIEILLDKTEFLSNLIFPVAGIAEVILSRRELWTEVSSVFRFWIMIYAWLYMVFVLWRTFLLIQDRARITHRLQESQLELMMGQIQPHFIFNTLSSIRTLVMVEPNVAYNMLYDFSNYLRANIDNVTNLNGIAFSAEVNHIKSYVNIEKVRFGDRFNIEFDIHSDNFTVPPLSIQPLVENAIKHGIFHKLQGGTVTLRSYSEDDFNIVEIEDTGIGFNQESANRVFCHLYYNEDYGFDLESGLVMAEAMSETMKSLHLLDATGKEIKIAAPTEEKINLSGNGSEKRKSLGMMNIFLRLREISNAKVEIFSQEDQGTKIKIFFPKTTHV